MRTTLHALTAALLLTVSAPAVLAQAYTELPSDAESQAAAFTNLELVRALQSDDLPTQEMAMQTVIAHPELFNVGEAKFAVVRLYRDHADPNVRILALATLHAMQESWSMNFLLRSIDWEEDARIKRLTQYVAYDYHFVDHDAPMPEALAAVIR
ncbi:MAG: hypothetical protein AAF809_10585 [Bacteroidota bacterium]